VKYLSILWTYLDLLYRFGRYVGEDDHPNIRLAVARGTQPVQFGGCMQTLTGTPFTLCSGVRQRIGRS